MTDEHFRKLERMYGKAPCNRSLSPSIAIGKGTAEIRMPVQEALFHSANAIHGAYYFKLLDDAAFFAVQSVVTEVFVLTVSFNVHLIRPISQGQMHSVGTLVHASKTVFFADAIVTADTGKEISRGSGIFSRSKMRLTEEIGYG